MWVFCMCGIFFDKSWIMFNEWLVCIIIDLFELINEWGKCNINVI